MGYLTLKKFLKLNQYILRSEHSSKQTNSSALYVSIDIKLLVLLIKLNVATNNKQTKRLSLFLGVGTFKASRALSWYLDIVWPTEGGDID